MLNKSTLAKARLHLAITEPSLSLSLASYSSFESTFIIIFIIYYYSIEEWQQLLLAQNRELMSCKAADV